MAELFTIHALFTLLMLTFLQAVLGFDNLLYISIASRRAPPGSRSMVRRTGIAAAIVLRLLLLVVLVRAISLFREPLARIDLPPLLSAEPSLHALIVLGGGAFVVYTAFREIFHLLSTDRVGEGHDEATTPAWKAVVLIATMNVVFSFDSILSAIALTDVVAIMAISIVLSGGLMILVADRVAAFLQRNRAFEVLGLFILLIVGVMLLGEGGHLGHVVLWGHPVEPMAKSTFYFTLIFLVLSDIVQSRYQRRLEAARGR